MSQVVTVSALNIFERDTFPGAKFDSREISNLACAPLFPVLRQLKCSKVEVFIKHSRQKFPPSLFKFLSSLRSYANIDLPGGPVEHIFVKTVMLHEEKSDSRVHPVAWLS